MLWTVPTAGTPVKAEYSYTGRLWAGPNSPKTISVLAIPCRAPARWAQPASRAEDGALGPGPAKGLAMPWAVGRRGAFPYTCARRSSSRAAGPGAGQSTRDVAQLG